MNDNGETSTDKSELLKLGIAAWRKYPDRIARAGRRDFVRERLKWETTYEGLRLFCPEAITEAIDYILKLGEDKIEFPGTKEN